jgi:RHS repeat-associated protein
VIAGLDEAQQLAAEREASLAAPEAVAARAASRTRFKGLDREGAVALAEHVFDIEHPSWIAPERIDGGRISKYLNDHMAVELSPSGKHVLLDSSVPLRSAVGSGRLAPTSFTLQERDGAFAPENPVVPVSIATTVGGGVSLPLGVSVAPVQAAAPEAPVMVGDRVVYPGTASDTDFIVEPVPAGVETSWQLLSERSPQENGLKFRLPAGARLQLSKTAGGGAEVVKDGEVLAWIAPATGVEADGSTLPVGYSVAGDILTTHVDLEGSVAFPVMVDPLIVGHFGADESAGTWSGWQSYSSCGSCFQLVAEPTYLSLYAGPGNSSGSYGEWYIYAPGAGGTGGAGVTRVDLQGMRHENGVEQSALDAVIGESNGAHPGWTWNGTEGLEGEGTLSTEEAFGSRDAAFCADGAGGHDGGEPGLCNENDSGKYFALQNVIGPDAQSDYSLVLTGGAAVSYLDGTPPNEVVLGGVPPSGWTQYGPKEAYVVANDQGTGIAAFSVEIPPGYTHEGHPFFAQSLSCSGSAGFAGCPHSNSSEKFNLSGLETGVHPLGVYAYDAVGNMREEEANSRNEEDQGSKTPPTLYIDHTPPSIEAFGGSLAEASGHVIGSGSYTLSFGAVDGTTSAPQSGVHSLTVLVDGRKVEEIVTRCSEPIGTPAAGCYALAGSWTMEGEKYGAGFHTITVKAKDWLGNESEQSIGVTVNEAPYEAVGPGSVNLKSGAFRLEASDVAVASAGGALNVGRSYNSRELTQGEGGPLGPQWSLSLPDPLAGGVWQSLKLLPSGSVQATTASGTAATFAPAGSGFTSPAGYQTLTLSTYSKSPLEYEITNAAGDGAIFKRASGSEAEEPLFVPETDVLATGAGGLDKMTYEYTKTAEGITEPTEVIAPYPSSINCLSGLVQGCRALEFKYDTATTAGEGEKEWGEYKGRLKEVIFVAWNGKEMAKTPEADYSWDAKGRLRAEWNPQISPALKTEYGYDGENHVTAVSPPGHEPWLLHYGEIATDPNTGRLLSVSRFNAETKLWKGEALTNKKPPKLSSTSPILGTAVGVTTTAWSSTVASSYQWERCNYAGEECAPIPGATNATYAPVVADVGHELEVQVTGTDAAGSVTASSETSEPVYAPATASTPIGSAGSGAGQMSSPAGVAVENRESEVLVADKGNNRLDAFSASGAFLVAAGWGVNTGANEYQYCTTSCKAGLASASGFDAPQGIATNPRNGTIYMVQRKGSSVKVITGSGPPTSFGGEHLNEPEAVAVDPSGNVWVSNPTECDVVEFSEAGEYKGSYGKCGKEAPGLFDWVGGVAAIGKGVYVANSGAKGFQELVGTEWLHEYGTTLKGKVTADAMAADGFTSEIEAGSTTNKIFTYSLEGAFVESFGAEGKGNEYFDGIAGIAINPTNGATYVADSGNNRIDVWKPAATPTQEPVQPPPSAGTSAVTTIDYQVPLTGSGVPQMSPTEVAKWAQTHNVPAEATAIFPPTEPEGWPAQEYKRATIYYMDVNEHTVNVANPSSGISTAEYDADGNTTRTLSADNRAAALKEGTKAAEVATALSTESKYNKEETELEETLGPEHNVKLPSGSEVKARRATKYTYNEEGAPAGGPYRLVTETKEAARLASGKEEDPRTIKNSYTGQGSLGWELHEPTSTTVVAPAMPGGGLVHSAVYSASTGAETETVMPGSAAKESHIAGNTGAYTSQTVYYTPKTEASVAACQNHPEWANLPCQTQPAHQPEVAGLPALPVTTYTYNIWDEPETTKSTSGTGSETATRTETDVYGAAGRLTSKETTSTTGETLPKVSYSYNTETGLLDKQSTGSGSGEAKITEETNRLGQLTSYTDANGKIATYEYETEKADRLLKVTDEKGSQAFGYNETTGLMTSLKDSGAGTFSATYDAEENLVSETLPGGLTATTTRNQVGEPIGLEYNKETHCTEDCKWFFDDVVPSIHGQWLSQTSSLASDNYAYNEVGWLTQVQETPVGGKCATRIYALSADGDRTSVTRRPPAAGGGCATTGGEVETHEYDTADRLLDAGTVYNPFGDITALPAADAGGSELTSKFYADGQLSSQEQGIAKAKESIAYKLDPARRTNETITTGSTTATVANQYDGSGSTPSWLAYISGEWQRNIFGIADTLVATQNDTETPELQLANLHGDIIATVPDSETATKLKSAIETTEYGVPTVPEPPKYSWLGASALRTELPSGVLDMGARSYVPQLGRFLQPDPQPGGSGNAYAYTRGNPLNEADPSGQWTLNETSGGLSAVGIGEGVHLENGTGIAAGAIMPAPADTQAEEAFWADPPWDQVTAGYEEYEEYEEEYEYEYASYHNGVGQSGQAHLEPAVLYQPLAEALSSERSEHAHPEDGGNAHDASGDGCGDGGYCEGHWVERSGHGHRRGESIGADPVGQFMGECAFGTGTYGAGVVMDAAKANPVTAAMSCAAGVVAAHVF